jgi:hypothetical protein
MCLEGFPTFNGVTHELRSWISWLEDFFVWENFTDDEKMNLAQSLIEGEAEAWFYRRQKMILFRSWEHLRDCLVLRFGDRKDLELIRLLAKQDQFLKERRDESKIRRMKNTSVDPQEATPSMATIQETIPVEKLHNSLEITDKSLNQVDEISVEKGSKNDATLLSPQLLVSDSENLRNNELMAINSVVENLETVVIKTKIQKSSKMDVVNGDVGRIQQVSIMKSCSAHKMFDKMSPLKERLETKKKMKGLKSWMFKYKAEKRRIRKLHNQGWLRTWIKSLKYKFEKRIIEKRNDHSWLYNWSRRVTCRKIKSAKLQVTSELKESNSLWDNREVLVLCAQKEMQTAC